MGLYSSELDHTSPQQLHFVMKNVQCMMNIHEGFNLPCRSL